MSGGRSLGLPEKVRRQAVFLLLLVPLRLAAQDAATIPASSVLYDRLESLTARVSSPKVFLGDRPLSRRQLREALDQIRAALGSTPDLLDRETESRVRVEINELRAAIGDLETGVRGHSPRGAVSFDWAAGAELYSSDALSRRVEPNGLGSIDAVSHPFTRSRFGRPTGQGTVLTLMPTGLLEFAGRVAVVVEPRMTIGHFRDGSREEDVFPQRAYVRGVMGDVAVTVGVDELRWGHSSVGALFLSGNASPAPAILVSSDRAVRLPWISRVTGPLRFSALVADLGPSQDPPRAKLAGWQVNVRPWSRVELGVMILAQTGGGDSIPEANLIERIADLVPILGAAFPRLDNQISNKLAGGHLLVRFPELPGLDLFYELQFDDFDGRRPRGTFVDEASHLLGARFPLSLGAEHIDLSVEWHHTAMRLHQHGEFKSGVTYRQRIIGSPLGSHARGLYASAAWNCAGRARLRLELADELRDPSLFANPPSVRDTAFRYVRITDDPRIRGRRAIAMIERPIGRAAVRATVGYNRAWRSGGSPTSGQIIEAPRNEWMATLGLRTHLVQPF